MYADDRAIDLWAVCASLYELFTGHVMFPGRTNNEMLRLMMAVKGRFPNKLVSGLWCLCMSALLCTALCIYTSTPLTAVMILSSPSLTQLLILTYSLSLSGKDAHAVVRGSLSGAAL